MLSTKERYKAMILYCQEGQQLTNSEQKVIEYINRNPESICNLGIIEIAEQAFVSVATLSRALRKCGVEKITDIRYRVAKDNFTTNNILNDIRTEYTNTIQQIDVSSVAKIVDYIYNSKRIFIFGNGIATLVAEELEFYFRYRKINARAENLAMLAGSRLDISKDDLIIVFTIADENDEMAKYIHQYKSEGMKIVTCCCQKDIALTKFSDVTVVGCSSEISKNQSGDIGSCLGLRVVVRAIIEYFSLRPME